MIKFLLNQELREETQLSPNMTVLNYLRSQVHKTGTKEGCGSGDCGACTVVLGELVEGELQYRSVNSCLTLISALHGKQLITVEDLQDKDKSLHPAQQALVDFHGSQCGYCTPGFIMSMFALTKNKPDANKEEIFESLAGNLCRCTGYRPIVDAALSLSQETPILDQFKQLEETTISRLASINPADARLEHNGQISFSPNSMDELAEVMLAHTDARMVAGGTDLALEITQFHRSIDKLIYLGQVADMKTWVETDEHIEIGANVSLSDCYEPLSRHYPDFGELLHRFASLQVRNQGTLGGNIGNASPIGDMPPLLIALGAKVQLRKGPERRIVLLEDYFISYRVTVLQPGEFIEKVLLPLPEQNKTFKAYKLSKRLDDDISAVCGAFHIAVEQGKVESVRIAFGGMAATPKRATRCEQTLLGAQWSITNVKAAMKALEADFEPLSDFRASREYRALTAANMLYRFFIEQQNSNVETRVTSYV